MTSRWESAIDRQIREAQERGDFDNLPGAGKPIAGLDQPYDENWWAKELLRRENMVGGPAPIDALRKEIDGLPARLTRLTLESSVREIVTDLNSRIRSLAAGEIDLVDVETMVAAWRERRANVR
ncbi:MAG TPA: DUF1992 domain-containing protein [Pseudonocardiaceae bacterium]|nr:DUF1992 domain-containing protein [Pseudonocardiaceae bacterium]